ncbi:MAG: ScyD/ScyE family protein [Acidimicrobiia bacterium]
MRTRSISWALATLVVVAACGSGDSGYEVVLDGLNEPRGLWVLADGTLCVAEAGRLAEGQEVREGPTANLAETGSVSCVDTDGARERVIEQLPYVLYNVTGVTTGPADVVEIDGELYLLTGEGQGDLSRKLLRISDPATPPDVMADLLAFATETAQPDYLDEVNIISNPFAMIPDPPNERVLVTDGATGHVLAVQLDGDVEVLSDVPGHEVLTGIARGPDALVYVTSFSELPHAEGDGAVLRIYPNGSSDVAAENLTTPIDLAFDTLGRLYVLEFQEASETGDLYRGTTGRLIRLEPEGDGWVAGRVLVEGLPFPTALLIGDDDRIYISVHGAFSSPGSGVVVRFDDLTQRTPVGLPIRFVESSP